MQGLPQKLRWDCRGGAAVEFALLTPAFLLMLAGMLAYGLYFGALHSLQQLSADAARIAIAGLDANERDRLVDQYLRRHAGDYMLIDPTQLSFAIGTHPETETQYRVVLRYQAEALPIWNLYLPLPLPSRTMEVGATIRQGGV